MITPSSTRKSRAAAVGVVLMGSSLALWLALLIVPFLPFAAGIKALIAGSQIVFAEVAFWLGAAIAGPEATRRWKAWWRSSRSSRPSRGRPAGPTTALDGAHMEAPTDVPDKLPSVTLLRSRILTHWREFRPTLVRDLERSGELDIVVESLETTVLEKRAGMVQQGMSLEQADEHVQALWMISDADV